MSKIVSLSAENVKRISAVHIVPGDDGMVLIGGRNAQGKSSVLDSIMYALGGGNAIPDEPIRRGQESAEVTVDLGDIVVRRRFTKSGSTVTVKTKDNASYSSPQKVLDGLFSKLSFDPLKFSQMKPDEQAKTLIELIGIDTTDLDKSRAKAFEDRTVVNRLLKDAQVALSLVPAVECDEDIPEVRPDVASIRERIRIAESAIVARGPRVSEINRLKSRLTEIGDEIQVLEADAKSADDPAWDESLKACRDRHAKRVADTESRHEREIAEMKQRHAEEIQRLADQKQEDEERIEQTKVESIAANCSARIAAKENSDRVQSELAALLEADAAPIESVEELQAELKRAMILESAFDQAKARSEKEAVVKSRQDEADALTKKLDDIAAQKREKLAKAKYPIDGLSVSEDGTVLFDGIPFSQASRAQKIRTSVSIGLAMNPKLKVLLIQDGSLLDDDGLALVAEMAAQNDAQIWIERVGDKDESAIIIEDGHVRIDDVPDPGAVSVANASDEEPATVEKPAKKKRTRAAKPDGLFANPE